MDRYKGFEKGNKRQLIYIF